MRRMTLLILLLAICATSTSGCNTERSHENFWCHLMSLPHSERVEYFTNPKNREEISRLVDNTIKYDFPNNLLDYVPDEIIREKWASVSQYTKEDFVDQYFWLYLRCIWDGKQLDYKDLPEEIWRTPRRVILMLYLDMLSDSCIQKLSDLTLTPDRLLIDDNIYLSPLRKSFILHNTDRNRKYSFCRFCSFLCGNNSAIDADVCMNYLKKAAFRGGKHVAERGFRKRVKALYITPMMDGFFVPYQHVLNNKEQIVMKKSLEAPEIALDNEGTVAILKQCFDKLIQKGSRLEWGQKAREYFFELFAECPEFPFLSDEEQEALIPKEFKGFGSGNAIATIFAHARALAGEIVVKGVRQVRKFMKFEIEFNRDASISIDNLAQLRHTITAPPYYCGSYREECGGSGLGRIGHAIYQLEKNWKTTEAKTYPEYLRERFLWHIEFRVP